MAFLCHFEPIWDEFRRLETIQNTYDMLSFHYIKTQ